MNPFLGRLVRRTSSVLVAATFAATFAACGGGGGGGGGGIGAGHFAYTTQNPVYQAQVAVTPNAPVGDMTTVLLFSVTPSLPTGLAFDPLTGVVSGTPDAQTPQADYVVTASRSEGDTTSTLRLRVDMNPAEDLSAKTSFTDDDIAHLLSRTQFGIQPGKIASVKAMGVPAFVDQMLAFGSTNALEQAAAGLLVNASDPAGLEGKFPSQSQVSRYWQHLMLGTSQPFQEVLAFFWHDHFASSIAPLEGDATAWMVAQIDLWRKSGAGNLRTLLVQMARDWVMLSWLDGVVNTKNGPNENFAREFWELFTLGVDNGYTQADIVQAAKAFTGYRKRTNADGTSYVTFDTTRHSQVSKTIFGQTIAAQNTTDDYQAVVDVTVDNRPVAEFISKKLFEHFAFEDPSNLPIDAMAALFRNGNYEIKPVLAALFKSKAFYSAPAKAGLVKSPLEEIVGFVRSTGLPPIDRKGGGDPAAAPENLLTTLDANLGLLAQRPALPPSVNGWPVTEEWLSAQNMLDRANAVVACIADRTDQANLGLTLDPILPPAGQRTSTAVVNALVALLRVQATPAEIAAFVTYLDTDRVGGVVVASPFDENNATHVSNRVRGLLYVLSQHPSYAIR